MVHPYYLHIGLKSPGRNISRSTARIVYHAFVAPFDLDDRQQIITYKDGDGRNLHHSNLALTDRSRQMTTAIRRGRARSHFEKNRLPVHQLTLHGEKVADYPSITAASKKTGYSLGAIAQCIDGNLFQAYGYRWESPAKPSRPVTVPPRPVFNTYLWKKRGCPKTSQRRPIAAVNLSDQNMPGERWRPIEETGGSILRIQLWAHQGLTTLKARKIPRLDQRNDQTVDA